MNEYRTILADPDYVQVMIHMEWKMRFLIAVIITISHCIASFSADRLQVITAIDTTSEFVVRDAYTLFRSLRLFGGTFNNAAFMACILVKDTTPIPPHVDSHLLESLDSLNITYVFRYAIQESVSPTLNKFIAFELFDSDNFDYFLWLDADIFVFQDPMPAFNAAVTHVDSIEDELSTGRVYCTPEVYNFLERFPLVNETTLVWNRNFEPFVISDVTAGGAKRTVPHGTCNTGVVLFQAQGLRHFLAHLSLHRNSHDIGYFQDRFIDSLLFVVAVNSAGLEVRPLDYSLNHLAFVASMSQLSADPSLVHFIGSTYLHCFPQPIGPDLPEGHTDGPLQDCSSPSLLPGARCLGCSCMYYEESDVPSPTIVRLLRDKDVLGRCRELAGLAPIQLGGPPRKE